MAMIIWAAWRHGDEQSKEHCDAQTQRKMHTGFLGGSDIHSLSRKEHIYATRVQ